MTYYNLLIVNKGKTLSTPAMDRSHALSIFGKELGIKLMLEGGDMVSVAYLLDEWEIGPHWVNCTIPLYEQG